MIDLVSLAARDDLGALSMLQACSAGAVFSDSVDGGITTGVSWQWNCTAISVAGAGATRVYTVTFLPFDFTGTTYPMICLAQVGRASSGVPTTKLFAQVSVEDMKSVSVRVCTDAGAYAPLGADDRVHLLVIGRRSRKTSPDGGTTYVEPARSLLKINNNLGVSGL